MKTLFRFALAAASILVLAAGPVAAQQACDWPRWRGPNGDGISPETDWDPMALSGGPRILWKADAGMGYSSPAIVNGRAYISGYSDGKEFVMALDAATGKRLWLREWEGNSHPNSSPTIDRDSVYVVSQRGAVSCLAAKDGKRRWRKDLVKEYKMETIPNGYSGSPVVIGDLLVLNVNTAGVALDKETGALIWASSPHKERSNPNGYHATPVPYDHGGRKTVLLMSGIGLSLVDVETGRRLWFFEWFDPAIAAVADPLVSGDQVLISTFSTNPSSALLDISGDQPRVLWKNLSVNTGTSTAVRLDGYLYATEGPGSGGNLRCVEWKTGKVKWETSMREMQLTAAGGKLLILESGGTLRVAEANPAAYTEISSCPLPSEKGHHWWTPPVLCGGRIFCRNFYGDLVCIDVRRE